MTEAFIANLAENHYVGDHIIYENNLRCLVNISWQVDFGDPESPGDPNHTGWVMSWECPEKGTSDAEGPFRTSRYALDSFFNH